MIEFSEFLLEDKQGKNLHLEHLEDEILNFGIGGGRGALYFLIELRNMLEGNARGQVNMTVKWDGAPAIFAGTDPEDGKFFVAKKSVFNAEPILYKSLDDINNSDLSGQLKTKFTYAFQNFKKLGIQGVLQGDLMFTEDDLETKEIDGQSQITFQPNTIVYAVPTDSELAKTMQSAKIGVVWHTTYTGDTLQTMKASFGANIKGLKKTPDVWMDDASYKDVSGKATFTKMESEQVTNYLRIAGRAFRRIDSKKLDMFLKLQNTFTGTLAGASFKTYNNSKVREGESVKNTKLHAMGYVTWVSDTFDKRIDKLKSDKKKEEVAQQRDNVVKEVNRHVNNITAILDFQNALVGAKLLIVDKLNSVKQLTNTFVKTDKGFKVVNPEGYVAIDKDGGAVKLVDRMEFSYNNFTAIKSWDK